MKKTAKILSVIMAFVLAFSSVTSVNVEAASQKSLAKKVQKSLNSASDTCSEIAASIAGAWYFYIYESDDYDSYDFEDMVADFSEYTGVPEDEIISEMESVGTTSEYMQYLTLTDLDASIAIAQMYYMNNGGYAKAQKQIKAAKKNLKKINSKQKFYKTLKSYYSATDNFYDLVLSPSGNYETFTDAVIGYQKKIKKYKSDLGVEL